MGSTPSRGGPPVSGRPRLPLGKAASLTSLTAEQLLALVEERKTHIDAEGRPKPAIGDIPEPLSEYRGRPVWDLGQFQLWALRMGVWLAGYEGEDVIGYTGVARLLEVREQSVRKQAMERGRNVDTRGRPDPDDMPEPWRTIDKAPIMVVLFRKEEIRRWATQTGRLTPEGQARRLKPGRKSTATSN